MAITRSYGTINGFRHNPVTSKLEPIGFDGYDEWGESWVKSAFLGMNNTVKRENHEWHGRFFVDEDFLERYYAYLSYYSTPAFLNQFIGGLREA